MSLAHRLAAVSPFGPIFAKELRATSRRKRNYALRVAYLGLLFLTLLVGYAAIGRPTGGAVARAQQQSQLASAFFGIFTMFGVLAMGLIGPVLTCTAVGSERLAKTLPVLLMTPINTWQILGGKLFSRLLVAFTLLGLSLPVLALVRLLGGVEIEQMAASLCVSATFALGCAAIGLFYSTLMNRAYAVILLSYGTLGVLYLLVPFVLIEGFNIGNRTSSLHIIAATNPVFCAGMLTESRMRMVAGGAWVTCAAVQVGLAAAFVTASALVLRRAARTAGEKPAAVSPEAYIPLATAGGTGGPPPLPASRVVAYATPEPIPLSRAWRKVLFGPLWVIGFFLGVGPLARNPNRGEVADNPILWREVRRPLLARPWQRVLAVVLCAAILLVIYSLVASENELDDADSQIGFAIGFAGVAWVLAAVLSATLIAGEKEADTWTLLLTAPVSGKQIVWGKVAGLLRRLAWPLTLVAAHFSLFVVTGVIHFMALPLVLWVIVTFNSIWVAVGVYLSLRIRRVTFAVITNLMLAVVAYGVPPILLFIFVTVAELHAQGDFLVEQVLWTLPYFWLIEGFVGFHRSGFRLPGGSYSGRVDGGTFAAAVVVVGCLHLLGAFLILHRTARHFDATVGRAGREVYAGSFESAEAVGPATRYAAVWRRGVALFIDETILRAAGALGGLAVGIGSVMTGQGDGVYRRPEDVIAAATGWGVAASFAAAVLYYPLFEFSRLRATPGKWVMGLFVTDDDGRGLSFGRALLRAAVKLLSGLTLLIGYALALFTKEHKALHDRWAGTVVLRR